MSKVSSGAKKSGPPAHPNRHAFTHNPGSRLTRVILATPLNPALCTECRDVLEWRKKYRKYKPLTVAKKCVRCGEKTIKEAYHVACAVCADREGVCRKCLVPKNPEDKRNTKPLTNSEGNSRPRLEDISDNEHE